MSLSTTTNRSDRTLNGVATVFAFDFKVFAETDLEVIHIDQTTEVETVLTLGVDYTVSGVNADAGSVTLVAGPGTSGDRLIIKRVMNLVQPTRLRNQGDFFPATHERAFDRSIMIDQQQQEEIDRSFKLSPSATAGSVEAPSAEPGYALGWDALGNLTSVPNTGADQTLAWTAADAVVAANAIPIAKTQAVWGTPDKMFAYTPARAGTADFGIAYGGSSFSGIKDPGMFIGYNADRAAGLTGSATEPEFYQAFESNYWDGTNLMCEWYIHYQSPDRTTVQTFRPIAMSVGRDNNSSKWARVQTDIGTGSATKSVYAILAGPTNLWSYIATQTGTYVPLYIYNSTLNLVSSATANSAITFWNGTPTSKWQHILYQGDNNLYTWDQINGRFIVKYTAGATNLTSVVEMQASLKVDGTTTMAQGVLVQGKAFTANGATTTFTYPANTRYQYITTSAASLATTLPATSSALDGAVITLCAGSAVATATWVAGTGGATIVGAPAALVANSPVRMIYHHATTSWYPY